ncbi:MAG TPA: YcxB family protein [Thermoanaerobaculia bacterium]|nr:YcxB family protein [Thermoanaerobaculia bacterium]
MSAEYRYRLDLDHLMASTTRYQRVRWSQRFMKRSLPIAGVLFVAVGGFALWHGEWVLGAATLLIGGFYLSMTRFSRWNTRFINRKSPHFDDDFVLRLGEEGVRSTGTNSELQVAWPAVTEAWRFREGLLLFHGPRQFFWLPDSAAVGDARREAERLLDAHVQGGLRQA